MTTNSRTNKGKEAAVSARQFATLRARVKKLEDRVSELEEGKNPAAAGAEPEGKLSKFRGFVKRNPAFWTGVCLLVGFFLGCYICDLATFGRY